MPDFIEKGEGGQPADGSCSQGKAYSHPSPGKRIYALREVNFHGVDDDTNLMYH